MSRDEEQRRIAVTAMRSRLCSRLHEHGFVKQDCNGRDVVCGFCDWTVKHQLEDAVRAAAATHLSKDPSP